MRRAARIQNEKYATFRTRLHQKSLPECRSCHEPIHANEVVYPWCGAKRTTPTTGITQPLPKLPVPVPWYRTYDQMLPGVLLTFFQARLWLWLWPLSEHAVIYHRTTPQFMLFYFAMVAAILATIFWHCRWMLKFVLAFGGFLVCWIARAFLG